jgi:hypothetical protein
MLQQPFSLSNRLQPKLPQPSDISDTSHVLSHLPLSVIFSRTASSALLVPRPFENGPANLACSAPLDHGLRNHKNQQMSRGARMSKLFWCSCSDNAGSGVKSPAGEEANGFGGLSAFDLVVSGAV